MKKKHNLKPWNSRKAGKKEGSAVLDLADEQSKIGSFMELVGESSRTTFPTKENLLQTFCAADDALQADAVGFANSASILVHRRVYDFIETFLSWKRKFGSAVEKELYTGIHDVNSFLFRLILKRPICFFGCKDRSLLRDGSTPPSEAWELVGTDKEHESVSLKDYLSYDEMQISALISVSSKTYFINKGNRDNQAIMERDDSKVQREGVYAGLVGARFEKPGRMESAHMLIKEDLHTVEKGYGGVQKPAAGSNSDYMQLWARLYGVGENGMFYFPTYQEAAAAAGKHPQRYVRVGHGGKCILNVEAYMKRLLFTLEPFFVDASRRAYLEHRRAYVHLVGIGLGVWAVDQVVQAECLCRVVDHILRNVHVPFVTDVNFSWFPSAVKDCGGVGHNMVWKTSEKGGAPGICNEVRMLFSKRDPAEPLVGEDRNKLLVATYAWDGNAFPGNEYWLGMLGASGDPAAACCSNIAELQNPYINRSIINSGRIGVPQSMSTAFQSIAVDVSASPPHASNSNSGNSPSP